MPRPLIEAFRSGTIPPEYRRQELEHQIDPELFWVFHGQGSQKRGMYDEVYAYGDHGRDILDFSDARLRPKLGFSILELAKNGPDEKITEFASELVVPANAALLAHTIEEEHEGFTHIPGKISGNSLGLYNAFPVLEIMSYPHMLDVVHERNRGLRLASERYPGKMLSVPMNEHDERLEDVLKLGGLWKGLVNSSSAVVVSGEEGKIIKAAGILEEQLKADDERRLAEDENARELVHDLTILNTFGAYHSPLMEPAIPFLQAALDDADIHDPFTTKIKLYGNVHDRHGKIQVLDSKRKVPAELIGQLTNTVYWNEVVQAAIHDGARKQAEPGAPILNNSAKREHGGKHRRLMLAIGAGALAAPILGATILHYAEKRKDR